MIVRDSRRRMGRPSHKALRIDINGDADTATRRRRGSQHGAQKTLQIGLARRLDGEPEAMTAAQHGDGRLSRPKQQHFVVVQIAADRRKAPTCVCFRRCPKHLPAIW